MSGIENYTAADEQKAIAQLRQINPLAPDSGILIGHTRDGRTLWFPRSFLAGYGSVLNGTNLVIVNDFFGLGLAGQLSDGTIAFLPSFRDGIQTARNELRFAILAEAQRRTYEQMDTMKLQQEDMRKRIADLERELSKQKDGNSKKQD